MLDFLEIECYNKITKRKGEKTMYKSDKTIGMSFFEALRFVEKNDLWDEVFDFKVDNNGIVLKVIH